MVTFAGGALSFAFPGDSIVAYLADDGTVRATRALAGVDAGASVMLDGGTGSNLPTHQVVLDGTDLYWTDGTTLWQRDITTLAGVVP